MKKILYYTACIFSINSAADAPYIQPSSVETDDASPGHASTFSDTSYTSTVFDVNPASSNASTQAPDDCPDTPDIYISFNDPNATYYIPNAFPSGDRCRCCYVQHIGSIWLCIACGAYAWPEL